MNPMDDDKCVSMIWQVPRNEITPHYLYLMLVDKDVVLGIHKSRMTSFQAASQQNFVSLRSHDVTEGTDCVNVLRSHRALRDDRKFRC